MSYVLGASIDARAIIRSDRTVFIAATAHTRHLLFHETEFMEAVLGSARTKNDVVRLRVSAQRPSG